MVHNLLFRREKYSLQDGPKLNLIWQLDPKVNLFYHTRLGFWPQLLSTGFLNVAALWSTIRSCCIFFILFLALELAILHIFQFFWIFGTCLEAWIKAEQNTISTPTKIPPLLSSNQKTFSPIFFSIFLSPFFIPPKITQIKQTLTNLD